MPRTMDVLSIFVASPSDVAEERDILEPVVNEFNSTVGSSLGVQLELLRWETHVAPKLGSDPQSVVNEAIGDNYDIFIGILWGRFGTPTPRAGSGTEEEFLRAYNRVLEDPSSVRMMMYFKEAPIQLKSIIPDQIASVQKFRQRIESLGILGVFADKEDFAELLRLHLFRAVQEWQQGRSVESDSPSDDQPGGEVMVSEEDLDDTGLLELTEEYEENLERTTSRLMQISNTIGELGQSVAASTSELTTASNLGITLDRGEMKRIFKRVADTINSAARVFEADVPLYAGFQKDGLIGMARAVPLMADFGSEGKDRLEEGLTTMRHLQPVIRSSRETIIGLRASIVAVPRISTDVNRARRRIGTILDRLIAEMETGENLSREIELTILRTLEGMDDARAD